MTDHDQRTSGDVSVRGLDVIQSIFTRRDLLKRSVAFGVSGTLAGLLLSACGGDDDDDDSSSSNPTEETSQTSETTATEAGGGSSGEATAADTAEESSGDQAAEQVIRLPSTEPIGLDPAVSYGYGLSQFRNIFEGLVGIDPSSNEVVPQLAETYEANDDATEYTFTLRDGLMWSDGTPLASGDFVWSWKRVLDPETQSQYIPALYAIAGVQAAVEEGASVDDIGVEAVDDTTLKVTLSDATPYFPLLATTWTYYPVPQHVVDEKGTETFEAGNLVSTGPYVLTEWQHNQSIVLEPNPNYWGDQPTITRAEYSLFDDEIAQGIIAFENNELDFAEVPPSDIERVQGDSNLQKLITEVTNSSTRFVVCDCSNAPTDDPKVRQALYMAIDRNTLADQVRHGTVAAAPTILPPDITGYNPDAALEGGPDKAKELLAEAGYDDPSQIDISLVYISTADYKLDAEYVQNAWQQNLGINVRLDPIEQNTYSDWRASRETEPYNTYIGQWGSDFSDASNWFNQNFTHASDHYRNHWDYPDFDNLVEMARVNTDEDERKQQYEDAEVMIVEQAPIIPLYHAHTFYLVQDYLEDIYLPPLLTVISLKYASVKEH